jgi:hypothetical protein
MDVPAALVFQRHLVEVVVYAFRPY